MLGLHISSFKSEADQKKKKKFQIWLVDSWIPHSPQLYERIYYFWALGLHPELHRLNCWCYRSWAFCFYLLFSRKLCFCLRRACDRILVWSLIMYLHNNFLYRVCLVINLTYFFFTYFCRAFFCLVKFNGLMYLPMQNVIAANIKQCFSSMHLLFLLIFLQHLLSSLFFKLRILMTPPSVFSMTSSGSLFKYYLSLSRLILF